MPVDESIHGESSLVGSWFMQCSCVMFHHPSYYIVNWHVPCAREWCGPIFLPHLCSLFCPPYAPNFYELFRLCTKVHPLTQHRPPKAHRQISRHVSLSHHPRKKPKPPLFMFVTYPHSTRRGVSRMITDYYCIFPAEWMDCIWNSLDASSCVIIPSTQNRAHRFCVGFRASKTDGRKNLPRPSVRENARA